MEFPRHEASLHLTHNEHKSYYRTVAESIEDKDHGYTSECWVSDEQRERAIASNECWSLQWYPDTPVGFYVLSAADLDVLLEAARKHQKTLDEAIAAYDAAVQILYPDFGVPNKKARCPGGQRA